MDVTYDVDTDTLQAHTRRYERERERYRAHEDCELDLRNASDVDDVQRARIDRVMWDTLHYRP